MYSILAGIMISLGCIINLQVGGVGGALFFSLGLITILMFNLDLFYRSSRLTCYRPDNLETNWVNMVRQPVWVRNGRSRNVTHSSWDNIRGNGTSHSRNSYSERCASQHNTWRLLRHPYVCRCWSFYETEQPNLCGNASRHIYIKWV